MPLFHTNHQASALKMDSTVHLNHPRVWSKSKIIKIPQASGARTVRILVIQTKMIRNTLLVTFCFSEGLHFSLHNMNELES